jgi:membrane associated rhomboid family serine protease
MPRRNIVVLLIIALNFAVFFLWSYANPEFMEEQFTISWLGLSQGRVWTLLTAEFSHNFFWHLLINMMVLNSFGSLLETVLGRAKFLALYLTAAIFASLGHALVSAFLVGEPEMGAVGASGAIAGLVIVFAFMFPREKLLLFFVIPFPVKYGVIAFVALDLFGLVAQTMGGGLPIGHGAHLGGALAGALFYFLFIRPRPKVAAD